MQTHHIYSEGSKKAVTKYTTFMEFQEAIRKMHKTYQLPIAEIPNTHNQRHESFMRILRDEVNEGDELFELFQKHTDLLSRYYTEEDQESLEAEILSEYADWLGDMVVFIFSEALRLGLDMSRVLPIIMHSNQTKLDENGFPIKDADGKFLKGPNFVPPEPELAAYVTAARTGEFLKNAK